MPLKELSISYKLSDVLAQSWSQFTVYLFNVGVIWGEVPFSFLILIALFFSLDKSC